MPMMIIINDKVKYPSDNVEGKEEEEEEAEVWLKNKWNIYAHCPAAYKRHNQPHAFSD